jgi:predicted 3-demethylubiquinone-9 3-methyltransferase (glyoxalase superfamily)
MQQQKIVPCLMFEGNAEAAVKFYTSIFKDSKILGTSHYGESASKASGSPKGSVMTIHFTLAGQEFLALNGGPDCKFTQALSLMIHCDSQQEIDTLWQKLSSDGGQEVVCGWLKDKFGLSWQVIPASLPKLLHDPNPAKVDAMMGQVVQMTKLDMGKLEKAHQEG